MPKQDDGLGELLEFLGTTGRVLETLAGNLPRRQTEVVIEIERPPRRRREIVIEVERDRPRVRAQDITIPDNANYRIDLLPGQVALFKGPDSGELYIKNSNGRVSWTIMPRRVDMYVQLGVGSKVEVRGRRESHWVKEDRGGVDHSYFG